MAEKKLVSRELLPDAEDSSEEWCITREDDGYLRLRPVFRDATGERFVAPDQIFELDIAMDSDAWQEILRTLLAAWSPKPEGKP